ncbi:hypothetical protein APUTEX25_002383 [Auxenochlorella protothecoides]|uniref:Protein transport protein Sec24-like n=1 Tax=Auxenochlorella protothecoides TaxID=3075 RepID=A0A3M7L0B1_AUXPR|nr:hypothetical protein APUTEX25_002383 [Auxenochlorella protothecoides]|eukprot:RMZ56193.1 hypothetical protein APUTEX25_002383 [Auxenochlorella protothecoides]
MGGAGIIRCSRCRTYVNPHMAWLDGGRSFSCNVCGTVNQTPVEYFSALDGAGRRLDLADRPELRAGAVEYVAPQEYMVRAPQPPAYVFVLDVSFAAVSSGLLASVCATIRASLDAFHGDSRTQVAFITFDATVHYYALRPGAAAAPMLVVADVEELFVPLPDELLGNLVECRGAVEALLDSLPAAWAGATGVDSATGPALQAAFLVMSHVGGKLMLFQAAAPSVGIGRVKARDNPSLYGGDREYSLRVPDDPFYKRFAAECSRCHVCVDVFAAGATYMDLPSLGAMPKYLGGQLYYYPGFSAARDGAKLRAELARNLSRETGWEAVMRIRCSKGLRVSSFFGHFFIRTTDLLSLPVVDADKAFSVEIAHEESVLTGQTAYVQSALLYTASNGERRIRVHTAALPIVGDLADLYRALDAGAAAALLAKAGVERSLASRLEDVRLGLHHKALMALREWRLLVSRGATLGAQPPPNAMLLPRRGRTLPALCMGLAKTAALRGGGRDVNTDERIAVGHAIVSGPVDALLRLLYPAVYAAGWGRPGPDGSIALPPTVPAGVAYCDPAGAYLIDNGRLCILWLGAALGPAFYEQVFGSAADAGQDPGQLSLEPARPGSELSARINAGCYVVRQGTPMEAHVAPYFVEDALPSSASPGFFEFMQVLQKDILGK